MPTDSAALNLSVDGLDYELIRQQTRLSDPSEGAHAEIQFWH